MCDIVLSKLPKSTKIAHPLGIVIHSDVKMGENCYLQQGLVLGQRSSEDPRVPTIGNNVIFGAHTIVIGGVRIGNNVKTGAGSIILKDVPDNTTVVGIWK